MKRRHFVAGVFGGLLGQAFPAFGQQSGSRVAIVIGVDKCVGFPVLDGAGQGAKDVAFWLRQDGYDVRTFIDELGTKPVRVAEIKDAVETIISNRNVQQLVVYFAGHGLITASDDVWLLSKAPNNSGETIGINSSYRAAKNCGIPNIVLISDACRSMPATLAQLQVTPQPIFPIGNATLASGQVDKFLATQIGQNATEFEIEKRYQGVFTATLLKAFSEPEKGLTSTLQSGEVVIPDGKLDVYLKREVPKSAQSKDFRLTQLPDCDVVSPNTFIAHVTAISIKVETQSSPLIPTINIINTVEFGKILNASEFSKIILNSQPGSISVASIDNSNAILEQTANIGYQAKKNDVQTSYQTAALWQNKSANSSGFVIAGSIVSEIATSPGIAASVTILDKNSIVSLAFNNRGDACNVALRFANGTGTILAGLRNYVGTVSTSERSISNVSYDANYEAGRAEPLVQKLRATSAAAFQSGVLRFSGTQSERQRQAQLFGDNVRFGKSADPTLGIYAAYAFDEATLPEKVKSVNSYMRDNLRVELFDVAMLAGETTIGADFPKVVPCCPMLSVGWSFLASSKATLWPTVVKAQAYLISSPWTLFEKEGMDILMPAIMSGELG